MHAGRAQPDDATVHALCTSALPMVTPMVRSFLRRYPQAEEAELRSLAHEAIVMAARAFDASLGTFDRFASAYIWNQMLSHVRQSARDYVRAVAATMVDDETVMRDRPLSIEQSVVMDPAEEQARVVSEVRRETAAIMVHALLETARSDETAEDLVMQREAVAMMDEAAGQFGEPERTYFRLFYREERTQEEVAHVLGRSTRNLRALDQKVRRLLDRALRQQEHRL